MKEMRLVALSLVASGILASQLPSQQSDADIATVIAAWTALEVAPGREAQLAKLLARELPGWTADSRGNLIRRLGSGSPRRVVACALDIPNFVVSQITNDGYVRVHRAGNAPVHPLWDQFFEAQRIKVLTQGGRRVPGVVAVANGHFARQHRGDTLVVNVDQLWIDVGAESRAQVEALGIALLDPVLPDRPLWTYEGIAAGPAAGARAGCAAVATAAQGTVSQGETIFVLSTQRYFGWLGLAGILARLGPIDALTLVDSRGGTAIDAVVETRRLPAAVTRVSTLPSARVLAPRVRFEGTFVESVSAADARTLLTQVMREGGVSSGATSWIAPRADTAIARSPRADVYQGAERQFFTLADIAGVSGHEWRVRRAVMDALPAWARQLAVVDTAGNVIVAVGPDRDSVLFMAHMDEVGFEVERILADGQVTLARRGGVVIHAWEGEPAYLHFDPDQAGNAAESLRGVFVPRDSARVKAPVNLTAWFGMDSAALVARGVRPGMGVTAYKRADRLAGTRVTGRSSDDRTGSAALLLAVRALDPARVTRKTIFAWSVREEGGLNGARAFASAHGASLSRIYSIDTFVSSDTPLELPTFAFTPLGKGAVLRGLDDGAISPQEERDRILRLARANDIPIQVGTTHGATDGSAIAIFGAPNTGLSWPGRYSHSPGEVLDLRDVVALSRLIAALAAER
ncbi:MAG: hypothetical protein ABI877_05435 [Gemmatimonadaceae bacterium]